MLEARWCVAEGRAPGETNACLIRRPGHSHRARKGGATGGSGAAAAAHALPLSPPTGDLILDGDGDGGDEGDDGWVHVSSWRDEGPGDLLADSTRRDQAVQRRDVALGLLSVMCGVTAGTLQKRIVNTPGMLQRLVAAVGTCVGLTDVGALAETALRHLAAVPDLRPSLLPHLHAILTAATSGALGSRGGGGAGGGGRHWQRMLWQVVELVTGLSIGGPLAGAPTGTATGSTQNLQAAWQMAHQYQRKY